MRLNSVDAKRVKTKYFKKYMVILMDSFKKRLSLYY